MKLIKIGVVVLSLLAFSQVNAQEKKERQRQDPEEAFKKLDTNKDGKINLEEFKARTVRTREGNANNKTVDHEKAFTAKDTNSDGFISLEEFKTRPERKKKD